MYNWYNEYKGWMKQDMFQIHSEFKAHTNRLIQGNIYLSGIEELYTIYGKMCNKSYQDPNKLELWVN